MRDTIGGRRYGTGNCATLGVRRFAQCSVQTRDAEMLMFHMGGDFCAYIPMSK